jgi:hypothetical protein
LIQRRAPPFRELRPVLGEKIRALEQAWLLGSPDDRTEIEIVLDLLRRQATDDRSVLLQPPMGTEADGPIRLGRIRHGRRELGWLGVTEQELTQHAFVGGRSGSGKSTLLLSMLLQLRERSIKWLAFDWKRSARALQKLPDCGDIHVACLGRDVGATMAFNVLVPPPGVPVDTHQRQLCELIAECWYAGDGVISLLSRAMSQCYAQAAPGWPTMTDIQAAIDDLPAKSREVMWKTSAQRILSQMTSGQLGRIFGRRSDSQALDELLRHHTIVELDGLATADANFLTQHIMRWITAALLAEQSRERLRFVCLVEEAHHLLAKKEGGRETVLETCLREGREVGLGIMLADQSISAVSPTALANCYTSVCLNVRQRTDVSAAAGSLLLTEEQREMLGTLPVGEAIVRLSDRWPWPVHISIPLLDIPKGQVTDMDVRMAFLQSPYAIPPEESESGEHDRTVYRDSGSNSQRQDQSGGISPLPGPDNTGNHTDSTIRCSDLMPFAQQEERRSRPEPSTQPKLPNGGRDEVAEALAADGELRVLLEHVARHPLTGVAQRCDELGVSRRKGDGLKRALIELGLARAVNVPIPSGKTVLLELTHSARAWLAAHGIKVAPTNGGLPHAWWQKRAAVQLEHAGWNVTMEHVQGRHAFDISGVRGSETLLLEIETGASDWLTNIGHLEKARATHKAVVWLDPGSWLKAQSVIGPRVQLFQPAGLDRWIRSLT